MTPKNLILKVLSGVIVSVFLTSCAAQHKSQGGNVGALTGATAGILLDPGNRWRGALLGGSLGALFGGALTDDQSSLYSGYQSSPSTSYDHRYLPASAYQSYEMRNRAVKRGFVYGGIAGGTAGALLDDGNRWRGTLLGGVLGSFWGGSMNWINWTPDIPVLQP